MYPSWLSETEVSEGDLAELSQRPSYQGTMIQCRFCMFWANLQDSGTYSLSAYLQGEPAG